MWPGDGEPVKRHVMFDVALWVLVVEGISVDQFHVTSS